MNIMKSTVANSMSLVTVIMTRITITFYSITTNSTYLQTIFYYIIELIFNMDTHDVDLTVYKTLHFPIVNFPIQ